MKTSKTIALTRWTFVGKVTSLHFNMLSRLVIAFLPRSKHLLISWLQSWSAVILEPKETRFPHLYYNGKMGPDTLIFVFWMLSFKPTFSLSPFTFSKRALFFFTFSCKGVSPAYLRLLIFLPTILVLAFASSIPAFSRMYTSYKVNKQGDNMQSWCTPSRFGNSLLHVQL